MLPPVARTLLRLLAQVTLLPLRLKTLTMRQMLPHQAHQLSQLSQLSQVSQVSQASQVSHRFPILVILFPILMAMA